MINFTQWLEAKIDFEEGDEFNVFVEKKYIDQPTLTIPGWGFIKLFYSSSSEGKPYWSVHMIRGEKPGAGTLLYFAALMWVLTEGESILKATKHGVTYGMLASDTSLSPNALRARKRMIEKYKDYLYIQPHPEADSIKINRADGTDWRRKAEPEEATMWRLAKTPPFTFKFT